MILLTAHEGFIGSHFLRVIEEELREPVICIDKEDGWKFLSKFDDWEKVYLIIHNGNNVFHHREELDDYCTLQSRLHCTSL